MDQKQGLIDGGSGGGRGGGRGGGGGRGVYVKVCMA